MKALATLRRYSEHLPSEHAEAIEAIEKVLDAQAEALQQAKRLHDEALPKFNWGASALDANAIRLLNEVPGEVGRAIALLKP